MRSPWRTPGCGCGLSGSWSGILLLSDGCWMPLCPRAVDGGKRPRAGTEAPVPGPPSGGRSGHRRVAHGEASPTLVLDVVIDQVDVRDVMKLAVVQRRVG